MKRLFSNGWVLVLVLLMATGAFADQKVLPSADCDICPKTSPDGTLSVNWNAETIASSSLRDEVASYHDGSFEGQIGCGGGCAFSVRFTADTPIFLTGLTLYTQGGNATQAVVSIYADPSASSAGPPSAPTGPNDGTALWESAPMDITSIAVPSQFDIVIDNLVIETGDYYVVVWENGVGFAGMASDLATNHLDRNWAFAGDGWATINDAVAGDPELVGNFGITATYLPQDINGSYMSVVPQFIDFGILQLDDVSATADITISNIGTEDLNITSVDVTGLGFSTSLALPATVAAGATITMDATLTLGVEGLANGTFTINSDADNVPVVTVTVTAMVYDGLPQYMIWNPSSSISGQAFLDGLTGLGYTAVLTTDLFMFGDPAAVGYDGVFILLGMYGNENYMLQEGDAEVIALVTYAAIPGNALYMEGGDTWAANTPTSLHGFFGVDGVADGGDDLFIVDGENPAAGMDYTYSGFNNDVDHLAPANFDAAVLHTNPADGEPCGIYHVTPGANTIGNSFEFGGLSDSTFTVSALLEEYLEIFTMAYTDISSPVVSGVTRFNFTMDQDGPYVIEAYLTDNVGIDGATLMYNIDNGAFNQVAMTDMGDGIYSGDIPGQIAGTTVAYYVQASDEVGNEGVAPTGAPEELYVFSVVSHLPPVFVEAISGLDGQVDLSWLEPGTEAPPLMDCADIAIDEMPYNATGTNLGFGDDFDVMNSDGEDIAYQLSVMVPTTYTISLCAGTDYDSKLEVFFEDCSTSTGYYVDDACGLVSELIDVFLEPGTYMVVVDGFGGGTGNFTLDIFEQAARSQATIATNDLRYELEKLSNNGIAITEGLLTSSPTRYNTRELRELINYGIYHNIESPVLIDPANLVEVISMDSLFYSDFPVTNEITHYYRILAIYDDGESASEQVEAIPTNHPPMAPMNLMGSVDDETNTISLTWDANTDYDLASYNVYRGDSLVGNVATETFSEIVEDGAHRYVLKALDAGGMLSSASGHIQVLVGEVPPAYPTAVSGLDGTIELAWAPPGTEVMNVTVEIMTDIFGGETSWDIMDGDGNYIDGIASGDLESSTLYTWDVEVSPEPHTFTVYDTYGDGIYDSGWYSLYINGDLIITGGGDFDYSESVVFGPEGVIVLRRSHFDGEPIGPKGGSPANLAFLNIVTETIYENIVTRELRDLLSYDIYRTTTSPVTIEAANLVESVGMDVLEYTDFPLINGTTYYYKINAVYDSGSNASEQISGIPMNHNPEMPLNLVGSVDNATSTVTLDWDDNSDYDLAGYYVYRDEVLAGTVTESAFSEVIADGDYYYVVSSFDTGDLESEVSDRVQALVGAVPPSNLRADGNFDDHVELSWRTPGNPAPPLLDCGDELIPELPFITNGSTVGMIDNFDVSGTDNEDYAYQLYMPEDGTIDITLCGPNIDYDAKVEIFNGDCVTSTGYYDDDGPACDQAPGLIGPSEILGAFLTEGVYLVVVDGYSTNAGNYDLTITESATMREFTPESRYDSVKKLVNTGMISASEADLMLAEGEDTEFTPQFIELPVELDNTRETEQLTHYNIYRDGGVVGTTTETSYNDGVSEGTDYFYQVTATYDDGEESGPTNMVQVQANMAPGPIANFYFEMVGQWNVAFAWVDPPVNMDWSPCIDLEGIIIKRNGQEIGFADPLQWSFMDEGIPEGTNIYEFIPFDEVPNYGEAVTAVVWGGEPPVAWDYETGLFPAEWTQTMPSDLVPWMVGTPTDRSSGAWTIPEHPDNGTYIMAINDDADETHAADGNNTLISPPLDFSYSDDVILRFDSFFNRGGSYIATVEYRVGMGRWNVLETLVASEEWTEIEINLDAFAGMEDVYLGFHYDDGGFWAYGWAIDNVVLEGYRVMMMGDMDGDGVLSVLDITRYIEIMTELGEPPTLEEMDRMDLNSDGNYNVLDVVILIENVLNMGGLAKDNPVVEEVAVTVPPVTLNNSREWQNIPVTVDYLGMISGFQADLVLDPHIFALGEPVLADVNESIGLFTSMTDNTLRVLGIDLAGASIDLSSGLLMNVPVLVIDENATGPMDFSVEDLIISGPGGVEIVCQCLVSIIDIGLPGPTEFSLDQNYPNPFNPMTNIRYDLAETANASLVVYNMLGQQIRTLVNASQDVGRYEVMWNGLDDSGQPVATGIYIYQLQAGNYSKTIKMAYIK